MLNKENLSKAPRCSLLFRLSRTPAYRDWSFCRETGIFLRPATGSGLGGAPCGERLFGEPNRDIATLAQRFVIFGPVGHLVMRFFDLVTQALIVFVRHWLFCR